jgi:hypothetical protein
MVQTVDESEGIHDADMQAEGNQDAARALLRVKQKLDGYEEGEMRSLQGQVTKRDVYMFRQLNMEEEEPWEYGSTQKPWNRQKNETEL